MTITKRGLNHSLEEKVAFLEKRLIKVEQKFGELIEHTCCTDCNLPLGAMLSDRDIMRLIEDRRIQIDPLPKLVPEEGSALGTCKVDFRLGTSTRIYDTTKASLLKANLRTPEEYLREINLQIGEAMILNPGDVIIATTLERLRLPNDIVGRMEGKSSLARKGVHVHAAGLFDAGWDGYPMMELQNVGRIAVELVCGMPVCAMSFTHLSSETLRGYVERGTYKVQVKAQV